VIALGLMSGTSADGIEAAAVHLDRALRKARVLAHRHTFYPVELRERILALAGGAPRDAHEIATLHATLGDAYAAAAAALGGEVARRVNVIAVHGQTVAHYPGEDATLQLGDAARVAVRCATPVVSDFRSADVAAGGEGAPLVPFADHVLFGDRAPVAVLNLGGIANLTLIPTARAEDVLGFDTGPANMVSDALAARVGATFDEDGAAAARGRAREGALRRALAHPFFARRAPKSTGREDFGRPFVDRLLADVEADGGTLDDALATAVALTARTVAEALARETPQGVTWREVLVAGGGAANRTLRAAVAAALGAVPLRDTTEAGVPTAAREAVAFAILGAYRLRGLPNTLPRCTGASRAVSAGAIHAP
jgi:anhydro-N-acetylmuramic acid kinase